MLTFSSSRSSLKKKVALLACNEACESCRRSRSLPVVTAASMGVALSFLMSWWSVNYERERRGVMPFYLLESLVVNKAGCILGNVKLALLDVLAELPSPPSAPVPTPTRHHRVDVHGW